MAVKLNSTAQIAQIPNNIHCLIWTAAIALALLFCCTNNALGSSAPPSDTSKPSIALDPGHGGHNHGAQGPSGVLEKEVCLSLSRELSTALSTRGYEVVLTRSDDYDVPLRNRTAIANHHKTDLFISLHAAASYLHATSGIAIYHYQPPNPQPTPKNPASQSTPSENKSWHQIQLRHETQSRDLAQSMAQAMGAIWQPAMIQVAQTPLVVLEGADMPAILIEIGYLTNPATEKNLSNSTYMATLVQVLAQGIDTFFATRPAPKTP